MPNPYVDLDAEDFRLGVGGIIPRGYAWTVSPDTVQGAVWAGIAASAQSLHARARDLSERESDPRYASELLADWERAYGLPDHCTPLNATIQQRQRALLARIASQGGQSRAYFVSVAAALGYAVTITEFREFRVGVSRVGDPLCNAPWRFAWRVTAPAARVTYFRVGVSAVGDPLATYDAVEWQCRLKQVSPAHTALLFGYGSS